MLKQKSGFLCFLLALTMIFGILPVTVFADEEEKNDDITVYITFEGYNLGQGFYIEPTQMKIPAGSTADLPTMQLLKENGHTFDYKNDWGFYLDNISGFNKGYYDPPEYITAELTDDTKEGGVLGSFKYSEQSGWLNTINHISPDVGADNYVLKDGDVIRWQFSLNWGADFGLPGIDWTTGEPTPPLYPHADKTELIRALFNKNAGKPAQKAALDVIINPLATDAKVKEALAALRAEWVNPFVDVRADDWFFDAVRYVNLNSLMLGTASDKFTPDGALTYAMLATILWRYEGSPKADGKNDEWYAEAVAWADGNDINGGISEINNLLTKDAFAKILYKYAQYKAYKINETEVNAIIDISGDTITRAQAAAILMRFMEKI